MRLKIVLMGTGEFAIDEDPCLDVAFATIDFSETLVNQFGWHRLFVTKRGRGGMNRGPRQLRL